MMSNNFRIHFERLVNSTSVMVLGLTLIVSVTTSCTLVAQHKTEMMSKDIEAALNKGVDPLTIRCAYADEDDKICLVHSAARGADKRVDMIKNSRQTQDR